MAVLSWDDDRFGTGIDEFDDQHQKLIRMINDLNDAMMEGKGREKLEEIVDGMIDYTEFHFGSEEKAMRKFGYPDMDEHVEEHEKFVEKVKDFEEKVKGDGVLSAAEVSGFLSDWLSDHIKELDKQYGEFFEDKDLAKAA